MFDPEHVKRLLADVPAWNEWRKGNEAIWPKLAGADLSQAELGGADLRNARLHGATLKGADLSSALLQGARMTEANLADATLGHARLQDANLTGANLKGASLECAYLDRTKFASANLRYANFKCAELLLNDFEQADLSGALFYGGFMFNTSHLESSNFKGANLTGAEMLQAKLAKADLRGANLSDCNLGGADLRGALLDRAVMINTNLTNADLTGASIYGISAWGLKTQGTQQLDLVIRRSNRDAPFMIDDIEVAQFIYMMLDNQRIRNIIDKITSKVVLLLGRFGPERKAILDGLRTELRRHNYLPVIFDFEKPDNRDLTETVRTLAHLARFVIADLTDAKSLPQELETIIPSLPSLPVQPIILSGSPEYAMFEHFERYSWVLPVVEYPSLEVLTGAIQTAIIDPAESKAREQSEPAREPRARVKL